MLRIAINETRHLLVEPGRSLLTELREARVFLLSACGGRGACGTCRVRLADGAGLPPTPSERHWLSQEELAAGVRLACQVKVDRDLSIEIPEATFGIREYRTQVIGLRDLTYDIKEIRLKLIDPPEMNFRAGQFVQFRVPGTDPDQPPLYRSFSMASNPLARGELVFQIRYVPQGVCTTYVHQKMKPGDELTLVGPWGSTVLRDSDRDILFIAGGSGMSPVRSMLLDMVNRRSPRRTRYFFGAKSARDLFRVDEMRELEKKLPDFRFIPALSEPAPGDRWTGETGLITAVVDRHVTTGSQAEAYLCGSPMMVNTCMNVLKAKGIPDSRIFFDKFV